jgi:hypothetical protein
MSEYPPEYKGRGSRPGDTGLDGKTMQDLQGWDGEVQVGRIRRSQRASQWD